MKKTENFVRNRFNVPVRTCCASCIGLIYDDMGQRRCKLHDQKVRGSFCCDDWAMSERLDMIGCAHGCVQKREYQLFLIQVRAEERLAFQRGLTVTPRSNEELRRRFEEEHGGTIYAIK